VLRGGVGAGGYLALRSHLDSRTTAQRDAEAVEAAKDCVAATQAPDTGSMASSAQKIIECGSGAFRSQAILYSGLLVEAYQAANAHVQVSDLRAAVERNNADGSIEILVPLRVSLQRKRLRTRKRATACGDDGARRGQVTDLQARPGSEVTVLVERPTRHRQSKNQRRMSWRLDIRAAAFAVDILPGVARCSGDGTGLVGGVAAELVVVGVDIGPVGRGPGDDGQPAILRRSSVGAWGGRCSGSRSCGPARPP